MKRFAFIVHLRDINDIAHTLPFVPNFLITKVLRRPILWLLWNLRGRLGFIVRSRFKFAVNGEPAEGAILVIWLTGQQMMTPNHNGWVKRRVLDAVLHAQNKLRCNVVGLGALTASVTSAGKWLVDRPEIKAAITHGDAYATALAIEGVVKTLDKIGLSAKESAVAIVGATGIIGEALSCALAPLVGRLILVGRSIPKLQHVAKKVASKDVFSVVTTNIGDVKEADVVITATSWPEAIIKPEHLKKGAIVYEVSQPRNVPRSILTERPDVIVIDGSYAQVPESIKFWWMSLPSHHTFGCMAETLIQALDGDSGHHIGAIDVDFMQTVQLRAWRFGFRHADFTSFNRTIPEDCFGNVKSLRQITVAV